MTTPPVVAFGSLKGGVGKTTLSLIAAEALRSPADAYGPGHNVLLIDADVVGTELHTVWKVYPTPDPSRRTIASVTDAVVTAPHVDLGNAIAEMLEDGRMVDGAGTRALTLPSFRRAWVLRETLAWARTLERSDGYVQRRLGDLVAAARAAGWAVVIDLPAFDVGFAHEARRAVHRAGGRVFVVTDADRRSLDAVTARTLLDHVDEDHIAWSRVVVNRAPWPDAETNAAIGGHVAAAAGYLVVPEVDDLRRATLVSQPAPGTPAPATGELASRVRSILGGRDQTFRDAVRGT